MIYEKILRPLLFRFTDPEKIHHFTIRALGVVSQNKYAYKKISHCLAPTNHSLTTKLGKLTLPGPIGLAAGFDKYIEAPLAYPMLGFGFAELGSITYSEQPGNEKPRLWRLPKDSGLIVYYGLSNYGAIKTTTLLSNYAVHPVPFGVSVAPTTGLELAEMADDYLRSISQLHPFGDYITLNVSCPNVAKCDAFAQVSFIEELVAKTAELKKSENIDKDFFIKIGPHHSPSDLSRIIKSCTDAGFTGIIATNLIKIRSGINPKSSPEELDHPGGISGALLKEQSNAVISQIYRESQGKLKIIGVGGIFTAEDAYQKIRLGASALQLITGFIYGGPFAIKKINDGLTELLKKDGFTNISEAVGTGL